MLNDSNDSYNLVYFKQLLYWNLWPKFFESNSLFLSLKVVKFTKKREYKSYLLDILVKVWSLKLKSTWNWEKKNPTMKYNK